MDGGRSGLNGWGEEWVEWMGGGVLNGWEEKWVKWMEGGVG